MQSLSSSWLGLIQNVCEKVLTSKLAVKVFPIYLKHEGSNIRGKINFAPIIKELVSRSWSWTIFLKLSCNKIAFEPKVYVILIWKCVNTKVCKMFLHNYNSLFVYTIKLIINTSIFDSFDNFEVICCAKQLKTTVQQCWIDKRKFTLPSDLKFWQLAIVFK